MRGKPVGAGGQLHRTRSIPACAGEASSRRKPGATTRVYPRVCGGSLQSCCGVQPQLGLSPRVRGKPDAKVAGRHSPRSIPACAGEARHRRARSAAPRVYPRVCGGSIGRVADETADDGLSPRVRGKPARQTYAAACRRSIPACAGEATRRRQMPPAPAVYPRVCGGSACPAGQRLQWWGLSPRVRGKRPGRYSLRDGTRSIPACAGEAGQTRCRAAQTLVYPRVCGGSAFARIPSSDWVGLSPRVRGKRLPALSAGGNGGSIPACAGEAPWAA